MKRIRIKLLITLVLFTLAVASAWTTSPADARGAVSPGASNHLSATKPGAVLASGDPDAGQGIVPPPPPSLKQARRLRGQGIVRGPAFIEWVQWTGRIWATLYLRAAG